MTEQIDSTADDPESSGTQSEPDSQTDTESEAVVPDAMLGYLYRGAIGVLALLAVVATIRFYLSASRAISVWIAPGYEPLFQSAFNLAVVFACGIGLSLLIQQLR